MGCILRTAGRVGSNYLMFPLCNNVADNRETPEARPVVNKESIGFDPHAPHQYFIYKLSANQPCQP